MYTITPPGSHTGSDTDGGGESPVDSIEPRGRFSVYSTRNGTSVTSTSTIRLAPAPGGIYATTGRFSNSASYVSRQNDDEGYGVKISTDYGTGNSTSYRQQSMFQNSVSLKLLG